MPLLIILLALLASSTFPAVAETKLETLPPEVAISMKEDQVHAAGIETQVLEAEYEAGELVVPGVVAVPPTQLRVVATPAAGLVETLLVAPDEEVQEGAPIASLKSSELVEAQRSFLHAVSDAALATEKLRRDEQLFKERIIAERRLIVTRAEAAQARSFLDERMQQLVLDGMSMQEIETLRKNRILASALLVRAPIAGTILQRHGTAGERVPASAPLVTIARLDPIWVNLQVPIGRVSALEKVSVVRLLSFGAEGKLIRIGRTVDSATQSITAVAEFKAGKSVLRPGQAIQATLQLSDEGGTQWRVRADAVVQYRGHRWVFVRDASGFHATPVTLISETPQFASVRGALNPGDRVATRGVLTLLAELAATDK
jgi:RND family efflux transporter MFP subunit